MFLFSLCLISLIWMFPSVRLFFEFLAFPLVLHHNFRLFFLSWFAVSFSPLDLLYIRYIEILWLNDYRFFSSFCFLSLFYARKTQKQPHFYLTLLPFFLFTHTFPFSLLPYYWWSTLFPKYKYNFIFFNVCLCVFFKLFVCVWDLITLSLCLHPRVGMCFCNCFLLLFRLF